MRKWKELNTNEKVMIAFAIALVIILLTQWQKTWDGITKGVEPFKTEQAPNSNQE